MSIVLIHLMNKNAVRMRLFGNIQWLLETIHFKVVQINSLAVELSNLDGNEKLLKANFKGESNFHICSDNWEDKHSLQACKEMGFK